MQGAPTVTLYFLGSEGTWFPYGGDERTGHVALYLVCSRSRCPNSCPEAAGCGRKITFGVVVAAWEALRHKETFETERLFQKI